MTLHFDNITISGGVAVGKSTLARNLLAYLEPYHWHIKNLGDIHRQYLNDNIMPEATKVSDEFDKKIEAEVEKILSTQKNWIIQGWLSGYVAKDLDKTLRILLICKENALRVDRVANRDNASIAEAKQFIKQSEEGNLAKYKRIYGNHDFWNPKYYHLVIDTYSSGQLETTGKVLDVLGYDANKIEIEKKSH